MKTNNRSITYHGSTMDKVRKANKRKEAAQRVNENRYEALKEDLKQAAEIIYKQQEYVLESNHKVVNNKQWKKKTVKGDIAPVTEQLLSLENNFFNVIANKTQTAEEFLDITIKNINSVAVTNQKGSANESLATWKTAVNYFKSNVANVQDPGTIIAWDLETYGAKDLNGIWKPEGITEFVMQEIKYGSHTPNKTTVMVGMTKQQGNKLYEDIVKAIENGTIDSNEKLLVTAKRMAMYGNEKFSMEKTAEGYFKVKTLPTEDIINWKDKDAIKKGIDNFIHAGTNTTVDPVTGLRADIKAVGEAVNRANKLLAEGKTTLVGFNDSKFDKPIIESFLLKQSNENPAFKNLFDNKKVGLHVSSEQWLDVFGGTKLYTDYNSVRDLYNGAQINDISGVRRQENIGKIHLPSLFEGPNRVMPHMAEDDGTVLWKLMTSASEILNNEDTFLDHITKGLEKVESDTINLTPGQHVLRAKKAVMKNNGGRDYLNFAHSLSTGEIFTSDNHVIHNGEIKKVGYSAGYGVNKGQLYDILNISKFNLTDELRTQLGNISPEYSGSELYRVQLQMAVDKNRKDMRVGDLIQNLIFKNEKEMQAFLSGHFDVAAERLDNDEIKIVKGMERYFDRREFVNSNGEIKFEVLNNKGMTDTEIFNAQLKANTDKIITSRADNAIFKNNSYNKINTNLRLKQRLEEELGMNISGQDIVTIMSERVSKGQMPLGLDNEKVFNARTIIQETLGSKNDPTKLLKSTIDNNAVGIDMLSSYETMLTSIMDNLNQIPGFDKKSSGYKQELFSRVLKEVKAEGALHVYNNEATQNMLMLGDKRLQSSFAELQNIFEIDYTRLLKGDKITINSLAKPDKYANVLKLDLANENSVYSLISSATKIVHGDNISEAYQQNAMFKMFSMLNEHNRDLRDTKAFKDIRRNYKYGKKGFDKAAHQHEIAEGIIAGMKEIKSKNATKGFVNIDQVFMKALEGHTGFAGVLNSEPILNKIPEIIDNVAKNFTYTELGNKEDIETLARSLVKKHYVPNYQAVKNSIGYNATMDTLYKNATNDLTAYMTKVLTSASRIDGSSLSIQNNGEIILSRGENILNLTNIPRVKLDDASGVMYIELGSMKLQLFNELTFDKYGSTIKGGSRSNLGILNEYDFSKTVKSTAQKDGADEAIDTLKYSMNRVMSKVRQGSTINSFGGNDIDSNSYVALSGIKNVLVDMFDEHGELKHFIDNQKFLDKDLVAAIRDDLKYIIGQEKDIEDLSPETIRNLVKNMQPLLDVIREKGTVTKSFEELSQGLGFTGPEKRSSAMIAVKDYRPTNSTFGMFDNVQRPTVTQSGNSFQLRVKDIKKAKPFGIEAGNVITNAEMDKRLLREYSGIGKTTTDVMMNISYINTSSLNVLFENNYKKIMNDNTIDKNMKEQLGKTNLFVKNIINTWEQERAIDSRVHEAAYGLRTAQTQKLSKNYDIVSILNELSGSDYEKQVAALLDQRGSFETVNGEIVYKASHGKLLNKGESAIKWKGFADLQSSFGSKLHKGVFNYNYYNTDGTKLRVNEINEIIKANKKLFSNATTQQEMIGILDTLLDSKGIKGQFAIEDINAYGYIKTMTSGAEKGETKVVYATTGSYNYKVKNFFEKAGYWNEVKGTVLTDEAIDAYYHSNTKANKAILKELGFESLTDLKDSIRIERHVNSRYLFSDVLQGKTNVLANDAIVKHGNVGQMYQGTLSKAINSLSMKRGDQNQAVQEIVDMINSNKDYQFMTKMDLSKSKNNLQAIGVSNINGKIRIDDSFNSNVEIISRLDSKKFENLIRAIDNQLEGMDQSDRLIAKNVYVMNDDGKYEHKKEFIGSFNLAKQDIMVKGQLEKDANVILFSNSRENVKYVRDPETQTGVNAEYFELKKTNRELKKTKIDLETRIARSKDIKEKEALKVQLIEVKSQLSDVGEKLNTYSDAVKTMRVGDQELAILERITMTQAHADNINELINSGEVNRDTFLKSVAFQGKVRKNKDGTLTFDDDFLGKKALNGLIDQIKGAQYYDYLSEDLLTADMLKDNKYKHLKPLYDLASKHNISLGVESAEQQYQNKLADKARIFNEDPLGKGKEDLINVKHGFEEKKITDLNFGAEEFASKNLLVDLGEDFDGKDRYLAIPGLGMQVGDEEVKIDAQNKLIGLQRKIQKINELAGSDPEEKERLISQAINAREEAVTSLRKTIYGKNGVMHNSAKVEIDAVSYRLKASGVVTAYMTDDMIAAAEKAGVNLADSLTYTDKSIINGKTISEWEKSGEAFFNYKYASRQQFADMGYFDDDTLKQYGFLADGGDKQKAIEKMEDFLKTHGTYDISDRYPNTRNESMSLNRIFLGDGLAGNQTKVSVATVLAANGDNDGDSYSSFRIEHRDKNNKKYDGGLYELAKMRAKEAGIDEAGVRQFAIDNNILPAEIYDEFAAIEATMVGHATSFKNKHWNKEGMDIVFKDFVKNQNISNPDQMVLVPGGKSILGKNAFASINTLPSIDEFYKIEEEANNILSMANTIVKEKNLIGKEIEGLTETVRDGNSPVALDTALNIISKHGGLNEDAFAQLENVAIKRASIDKYAQEMMAKTGLAATGSVNLALNAVKMSSHYSSMSGKDLALTNYVWNVLDVAEEGVISSKKADGKTVYDDKRITNFKNAMKQVMEGDKNKKAEAIEGLLGWFDEHGNDIFEVSYKQMGNQILSPTQLAELEQYQGGEKIAKATGMMRTAFGDRIKDLSEDKLAMSYYYSTNAIGRNANSTADLWGKGGLDIAAAHGGSFGSNQQVLMGYGDSDRLKAHLEEVAQRSLSEQQSKIAKETLTSKTNYADDMINTQTAKAGAKAYVDSAANSMIKSIGGSGGLGKIALGVGVGLMVGGYASGNPLNDKSAQQHSEEMTQPQQTMSIPDFMEKQGGYVTGNSQQGYIINIKADTKKGRKHMEKIMAKAAEATVGGAVSVNMNIKNSKSQGITDRDIENYINRYI